MAGGSRLGTNGELVWTGTPNQLDPWPGDLDTPTTAVEITDTTFDPASLGGGKATTDIEGQRKEFIKLCANESPLRRGLVPDPYCGVTPGPDELTGDWHTGYDRDLLLECVGFGLCVCRTACP